MADSPSPSPSRADRLLDRIRNHRVAAVVIVISTLLGGLASLGDSVRTLAQTVEVDYFLPGCPPPAEAFWHFLNDLMAGRTPHLGHGLIHYD